MLPLEDAHVGFLRSLSLEAVASSTPGGADGDCDGYRHGLHVFTESNSRYAPWHGQRLPRQARGEWPLLDAGVPASSRRVGMLLCSERGPGGRIVAPDLLASLAGTELPHWCDQQRCPAPFDVFGIE